MKDKNSLGSWTDDFQEFASATPVSPPPALSQEIFSAVSRDLNPALWLVLAKLAAIHTVVGSLSLLLCSQFGMGQGDFVMRNFMGYGMNVCMAGCGALFLGLTTLIAGFVLSAPELRKIRRTVYAPILLLGGISLLVFLGFGANTALSFALAWLAGATVSGVLLTEASIGLRRARLLRS